MSDRDFIPPDDAPLPANRTGPGVFQTTHWSLVFAAGHTASAEAMAALESFYRVRVLE
jgi:hypothetical protein